MLKKLFLTSLLSFVGLIGFSQGIFVNRVFQDSTGSPQFNPIPNPLGVQWSNSITDAYGAMIMVGYTSVTGNGQDIYLVKHTATGAIAFATTFNTGGSNNDYGVGLCRAANGDILVCGTTDNGLGLTNYDVVVLRYNSSGTLLYSSVQDGPANKNDGAVSIAEMPSGSIAVAANTEDINNLSNFWLLKFNSTLSSINTNTYDYVGLNDFALGIQVTTTGSITLIGASASGTAACDYVETIFNGNTLAYVSETRNNLPGTALDQALAFCKDINENIYITGKAWNGTNFDIKTVKISPTFSLAWTSTLDVHGMNDAANAIAIDPVSGDVVIGGYATKTNSIKEIICARLAASSGTLIGGLHNQSSENTSGDAFIRQLCTNTNGDVYFIGGEKGSSGYKQVIVGKIKANGFSTWQKKITNPANDLLPSDIQVTSAGAVYAISIKDSITNSYITTEYNELELDTAKLSYGDAKFKDKELIVRFLPSALDSAVINNANGTAINEFGNLQDFMTPTAYSVVAAALPSTFSGTIKAIKVFPGFTTSYTTSTSHLGETIPVPDFWTTLLLVLPTNLSVQAANNIFNQIPTVAAYANPNLLGRLYVPSDTLYKKQYSLQTNTVYAGCDVNVQEAWDVIPNGGKSYIRCGVMDEDLDWEHKEWGYDGVNPATSKVEGWNFTYNVNIKSLPNGGTFGDWHATCVSGIIGANRNNVRGVAGIAGGNDSTGSKGVSIYNVGILDPGGSSTVSIVWMPLSYIANAIIASASPTTNPPIVAGSNNYAYNVHFQNHSWGLYSPPLDTGNYPQTITLLSEAMHTINRKKVTAVAARGNGGWLSGLTTPSYPSCVDDDWVIAVTGTGLDGQFIHNGAPFAGTNGEFTSSYGGNIDLGAPASGSLITTLCTASPNTLTPNPEYMNFGGTSAAAPHVSGAVGLLLSYLNDSSATYNNLAPEDCEAILQLAATDTDSLGYDQLTGHGRLNIGKALKLVQKPTHKLLHFGTNGFSSHVVSKKLLSPVDTIRTIERFQRASPAPAIWFQKGKYIVKTYEITSTVYHNLNVNDTIVAYWPRPSSAVTWSLFSNFGGAPGSLKKLTPREKTKILTCNNSAATLRGYIYQVKDSLGNPKGWWPVDTNYININGYGEWAEYSILTKNASGVEGIKEQINEGKNISVYPNPTNGNQTLVIQTNKVCNLTIDLYDVMGRKVKTVYSGKSEQEKTVITHDVANLPNSLYLYNINIDGVTISRKFIKD